MPVNVRNMLTLTEAAEHLGIEYQTLVQYRSRGWLPPADDKVGRSPLWKAKTLDTWKKTRAHDWWEMPAPRRDDGARDPIEGAPIIMSAGDLSPDSAATPNGETP